MIKQKKDIIINKCTFEHAIEKISQYKKVVTSSYHFMIWANAFKCDIELFEIKHDMDFEKLDEDSDLRKFFFIPINYSCVDLKKYLT